MRSHMTAQKGTRKKLSAWLATTTAALVAVSGLALAPSSAFAADPATPTIELSKTQLRPDGDTLTITGKGFDASFKGLAAYYGCADGANAPKGFYVQVGWIKDTWRPSQGGANNVDRKGGPNTWFADKDLNCVAPSKWTIDADGTASFSTTFEVTKDELGVVPEGGRYAVFTNGGGGGTQAVNEVSKDISFYPATVSSEVTAADTTGVSVDIAASGIPAGVTSAYGAIIEAGREGDLADQNADYVAFAFTPPSNFVTVTDGAAAFSLLAPAAKLDRNKKYEVLIWKQHSAATPENIYGRAPIEITDAQWNAVFPQTTTAVKFSASSAKYNAANSATVTVASAAGTPTGKATLKIAGQSYAANLSGGKAVIRLTRPVKVGAQTASVSYTNSGTGTLFAPSTASAKLVVTKATPKVSAKLYKSKVKTRQNARIKVAVSIPGSLGAKASKFKVRVYDGKKRLKTVTLSSSGKVNVKLPKLKKGTHKIKVTVLSTANTNAKSSVTRKLRVVR